MRSERELMEAFKATANEAERSTPQYQQNKLLLEVLLEVRSLLVAAESRTLTGDVLERVVSEALKSVKKTKQDANL